MGKVWKSENYSFSFDENLNFFRFSLALSIKIKLNELTKSHNLSQKSIPSANFFIYFLPVFGIVFIIHIQFVSFDYSKYSGDKFQIMWYYWMAGGNISRYIVPTLIRFLISAIIVLRLCFFGSVELTTSAIFNFLDKIVFFHLFQWKNSFFLSVSQECPIREEYVDIKMFLT